MKALALIAAVLALALFLHHRWEPPVLLVDAAMNRSEAPMLFAPCPLAPQNLPRPTNEAEDA